MNASNTLLKLLELQVIPIINENDTLSVQEIRFGDNDSLSAISAAMVHADYLFLMTDVQCMFTDNPHTNPRARAIKVVADMTELDQYSIGQAADDGVGTGGMVTKVVAAKIAVSVGIDCVIMSSQALD